MPPSDDQQPLAAPERSIVLVGLMGAGKSSIGRRLGQRRDCPFVDADKEIETAAGCSIEEIFERHGEAAFRDGERRVIARLLAGPRQVLATGGGAFMDPRTRAAVRRHGLSVWLRADLELLVRRTGRRDNRPLLKGKDSRVILQDLIEERYPVYAEADVAIDIDDSPPDVTTSRVCAAIETYLGAEADLSIGAAGEAGAAGELDALDGAAAPGARPDGARAP
ncbi:MAG: shikimate kinase [Kiloniellales bacterium]|nr:shikimate kinase [Kiloniellales bacterium]